jgi:hypothetical protein
MLNYEAMPGRERALLHRRMRADEEAAAGGVPMIG